MSSNTRLDPSDFASVASALHRGDFSALDPLFSDPPAPTTTLGAWVADGRFAQDPSALDEALACACFNGRTAWVDYLLDAGADLVAGAATGMNGFHWAANRGQLETVRLLLRRHMPLEVPNSYGGTVLGCTVWAAIHEPRSGQLGVIEALLAAGADASAVDYPTGNAALDKALRPFRSDG